MSGGWGPFVALTDTAVILEPGPTEVYNALYLSGAGTH